MTDQTAAVDTTSASTTATPATPAEKYLSTQEICTFLKRFVFGMTNVVTLAVTCAYISYAFRHYKVISEHPATLKAPYGNFDLSYEKVGYSFAIGRVIFNFLTLMTCLSLPGWTLFVSGILNLIFEIPMAAVAESNFGYQLAFSQLDLQPSYVNCLSPITSRYSSLNNQSWAFLGAYGDTAGKSIYDVCEEFQHEGALLRASLLFAWFALWLCFFLIAFFAAWRKSDDETMVFRFLVYFTGIRFNVSRKSVKKFFEFKIPRPRRSDRDVVESRIVCKKPALSHRSDSSTLVDEIVMECKGDEKV